MQMLKFLQLLLIFLTSSELGGGGGGCGIIYQSFETIGWKSSKIKAAEVRLLPMLY